MELQWITCIAIAYAN